MLEQQIFNLKGLLHDSSPLTMWVYFLKAFAWSAIAVHSQNKKNKMKKRVLREIWKEECFLVHGD